MTDKQIDEALRALSQLEHYYGHGGDPDDISPFAKDRLNVVRRALERQRVSVTLDEAANTVCRDLPEGYEVQLNMENGAAWVSLWGTDAHGAWQLDLPDSADKTLWEQIQDALAAAPEPDDG